MSQYESTVMVLKTLIRPIVVVGVSTKRDSFISYKKLNNLNYCDLKKIFRISKVGRVAYTYSSIWDEQWSEGIRKTLWRLYALHFSKTDTELDVRKTLLTPRPPKEGALSSHILAWAIGRAVLYDYALLYHRHYPKLVLPLSFMEKSPELMDGLFEMETFPPCLRWEAFKGDLEANECFWNLFLSGQNIQSRSERYSDSSTFKTHNPARRFRLFEGGGADVSWFHNLPGGEEESLGSAYPRGFLGRL